MRVIQLSHVKQARALTLYLYRVGMDALELITYELALPQHLGGPRLDGGFYPNK